MTLPKSIVQKLVVFVCFVGSFFLVTPSLQQELNSLQKVQSQSNEEGGVKWNSDLVRLMSFGHTPLVVDLMFIRMHLEDRMTHVKKGEYAKTYFDLDLGTDLDPRFKEMYFLGATFLAVVRGDNTGALKLISKGTRFIEQHLGDYSVEFQKIYWPDPWRLYLVEGYINLFAFQDLDAAARSYGRMSSYEDTPVMLRKLGESLKEPKGVYRVGHQALTMMIRTASDDEERDILQKKDQSLLVNYFIYQANELHAAKKPFPATDPLGGKLYVTPEGMVETTTPYEKMFGKVVAVPEKGR